MTLVDEGDIRSVIGAAARNWAVPGAVLALSRQGETEIHCHGVLNVETGEPVRPDSMFQIGSVTKVWTACLVLQMVDRGLIGLDAPVVEYIPEFRTADVDAAKAVEVGQLLCHTSGLDGDFMTDTGCGVDRLARFVDRCALLPHIFPPGSDFSYSNTAYKLAGRIVEVVSGLDFDSALRRYLIEPLELENSASDIRSLAGRPVSSGHAPDPEDPGRARRIDTLFTLPVSGTPAGSTLMTSAADLVSFAQMHLDGGRSRHGERVMSPDAVEIMQQKRIDVPVPARDIDAWGLGWMLLDQKGKAFFGHDGATFGQNAYLRVDRATGTIAVLFTNGGMANDFMMEVFAQTFDPLVGYVPTPREEEVPVRDVRPYVGTYRNVAGDTEISVRDGKLRHASSFRVDDHIVRYPDSEMRYVGDDRFVWGGDGQSFPTMVSFLDRDDTGRPQRIFSGMRYRSRVR